MAENQQDWWKDAHREETTKRQTTPEDTSGGYNTGSDDSEYGSGAPQATAPYDTYSDNPSNEASPYDTSNTKDATSPNSDTSVNNEPTYDTNPNSDVGTEPAATVEDTNDPDDDNPYDTSPDDGDDDDASSDTAVGDSEPLSDVGESDNEPLSDADGETGLESPSDDLDSEDDDSMGTDEEDTSGSPDLDGHASDGIGASDNENDEGQLSAVPLGSRGVEHEHNPVDAGELASAFDNGDLHNSGARRTPPDDSDESDDSGFALDDESGEPGFESEMDQAGGESEAGGSSVLPEVDESAFSSAPSETSGGGAAGVMASASGDPRVAALAGMANGSGSMTMDEMEDQGKEIAKEAVKQQVIGFIMANILPIIGIVVVVFMLSMVLILGAMDHYAMMEEGDSIGLATDGDKVGIDFTNHHLNDAVLALKDPVVAAVKKHGLDESWVFIILGMIQQETGGNVAAYPDVMQSSESQGWPMNTITDPAVSIDYGVLAFKNAVLAAESKGINDVRAILQGYNMNHAFINWMAKNGYDHWTSDIAEYYSMNIVYPAVTGSSSPATAANRDPNNSPWATSIGKPYYIRNGGDFHYPNAILHHLGVDYSGDGAIAIGSVTGSLVTEGSLEGYTYPIPNGKYQITSNFGPRNMGSGFHKGIDMQYAGALFHTNGPVYAAADGKVLMAGYEPSMGNYVKIDHGAPGKNDSKLDPAVSVTTTYMHMVSLPVVKAGMMVKAGDHIGNEGNTGNSFGDHVHFQTEQNGVPFNPRQIYDFTAVVG